MAYKLEWDLDSWCFVVSNGKRVDEATSERWDVGHVSIWTSGVPETFSTAEPHMKPTWHIPHHCCFSEESRLASSCSWGRLERSLFGDHEDAVFEGRRISRVLPVRSLPTNKETTREGSSRILLAVSHHETPLLEQPPIAGKAP